VGVVVAEDPADAVEVDDHRQGPAGALRAQDPHRHLAGRAAGHGGVLEVNDQLLDRTRLEFIDGPATLVRAELKQERRIRVGVDDGLGLRLEVDGVGHGCLLLRAARQQCCRATVPGSSADGNAHTRAATDKHRQAWD
jgi:hypothetical protein